MVSEVLPPLTECGILPVERSDIRLSCDAILIGPDCASVTDGTRAAEQYNAMATEYSADNDDGVFNSLYERPAMLRMLGDVAGLRVLDVGCGAGQLTSALIDRGATVTGVDVSQGMVDIARERYGDSAEFEVADLSDPLNFETGQFDLVVASLVMHYLEDWVPVLGEIRRILTPAGALVFSTHHPTMDWKLHSRDDYFAKKQSTETWTKGGRPFEVTTWRRPLRSISEEIRLAGFVIEALDEPAPSGQLADREPATNEYLMTHPHFLFIKAVPNLRADGSESSGEDL